EHVSFRYRFQAEAVDSNYSRVAASQYRAGDFTFTIGGDRPDANHAREVSRATRERFADLDASLFCDRRGIDHVHALDDRAQQSGEDRLSDRLDVVLGDFSRVLNRDLSQI